VNQQEGSHRTGAVMDGHIGPSPGRTIAQDFREFHAANPHVYTNLVELCRRWRTRHPTRKLGIKTVYERLRWDVDMQAGPDSRGFKLNNNYHSYYARLIMENERDLADPPIFETRRLHREVTA
jgi:hypothetical protein